MQHNQELSQYLQNESNRFEELCYLVLIASKSGRDLWECIKERHLLDNKVNPDTPNAASIALFDAGFREAFLGLYQFALNHQAKQLKG